MFFKRLLQITLVSLLLCQSTFAQDNANSLDTTRVRKTERIKKTVGQRIVDIPGEILKLPVYTVRFVSSAVISNPPVSYAADVIDLHAEAKPYIPIVGYNTRSGVKFGFGLRKLKNIAPTDHLKGKFSYSVNDYQSYKLETRIEKLFTNNLGLDIYFRYKKRPREDFYGIGNNSLHESEGNYTFEKTELKIELPTRIIEKFFVNFVGGYQISNVYDGRSPDLIGNLDSIFVDSNFQLQEGHLGGSRYFSLGTSFELDSRDNNGQPTKGSHALVSYMHYKGINRSEDLDFNKISIDYRKYINIWRKRVVAVRAYIQRLGGNNNNSKAVPIYYASALGGKENLRGYSTGRFIDNDAAMVSIEYRYPIYDILDAFFFLDKGRVYKSMTEDSFFKHWKNSFGFGIRAWNNRTVITTIQIAKSDEGTKFLFEMGAVW